MSINNDSARRAEIEYILRTGRPRYFRDELMQREYYDILEREEAAAAATPAQAAPPTADAERKAQIEEVMRTDRPHYEWSGMDREYLAILEHELNPQPAAVPALQPAAIAPLQAQSDRTGLWADAREDLTDLSGIGRAGNAMPKPDHVQLALAGPANSTALTLQDEGVGDGRDSFSAAEALNGFEDTFETPRQKQVGIEKNELVNIAQVSRGSSEENARQRNTAAVEATEARLKEIEKNAATADVGRSGKLLDAVRPLIEKELVSAGYLTREEAESRIRKWHLDLAKTKFERLPARKQLEALSAYRTLATTDENGMLRVPDLPIQSVYKEGKGFARHASKAAQSYSAIVVHYTGTDTFEKAIPRLYNERIGYQFYIDKDGTVAQAVPLTMRSNHIAPVTVGRPPRSDRFEIENRNSISIAFVGTDNKPTAEQLQSAKRLAAAIIQKYQIPLGNIVGHGEIQAGRPSADKRYTPRAKSEGMALVAAIRADWEPYMAQIFSDSERELLRNNAQKSVEAELP